MKKQKQTKLRKWIAKHTDLIGYLMAYLGIAFAWWMYLYSKNKCGVGFAIC